MDHFDYIATRIVDQFDLEDLYRRHAVRHERRRRRRTLRDLMSPRPLRRRRVVVAAAPVAA